MQLFRITQKSRYKIFLKHFYENYLKDVLNMSKRYLKIILCLDFKKEYL